MVLQLSDLGPSCHEIRDLPAPSSNIDDDKTGHMSRKNLPRVRTEEAGGDDQDNTELARKKKAKKDNSEPEDDSSSSDNSCFVALVTASNLRNDALYLPQDLTSSISLKRKCCEIVLTDERNRSWALDLRFNKSSDTFYISRGWRSFCDENGKKAGGVFVFKLVGNGETPLLSFCSTESINDGLKGYKNNKENCMELERKKKRLRCKDSTSQSQNRFVTLKCPDDRSKRSRLYLPLSFRRENGINKPGKITLLGKDGTQWLATLRCDGIGKMCFGKGWKEFAKANGLKTHESFTLESIWKGKTPMLSLYREERSSRELVQNTCLPNRRDSLSPIENRLVTLTLTHDILKNGRLNLSLPFTRKNGLDKPGVITLLGKDGTKWEANLRREASGRMRLKMGWKDFAKANGLEMGESFTLESIWENGIPMLSLFSTESTSDRKQQGECSKDGEKESIATEPSSGNKTRKATNNREERRDSSSAIQNRFVTLTLTLEDVRDCKLILPSQFMKANGINKLGKITLLGKNRMKWFAYLLSKDGIVALGCGWKGFCEANGVKAGESFTLECIYEQDTAPVFKFCSNSKE